MRDADRREAEAKARYMRLGLIRLAGMALVIAGLQIWHKGAFGWQDELGGKLLTLLGVALLFLVPALLRRRWRERG